MMYSEVVKIQIEIHIYSGPKKKGGKDQYLKIKFSVNPIISLIPNIFLKLRWKSVKTTINILKSVFKM